MKQTIKFYSIILIIIMIFVFIKTAYNNNIASSIEKEHLRKCEYINKNDYKIVNISDQVFQEKTYNYAKDNKVLSTKKSC
jgi:hypothetical protein